LPSPPRRIRTLRRSSLVAALALLLAGCVGTEREQAPQPELPAALAAQLATRSEQVAASLDGNDPCRARAEAEALQQQTIAAVNDGRVPARYQEELTSSVNALVASIVCTPSPDDDAEEEDHEGEEKEQGKSKGRAKSKSKGRGKHAGKDDD